MRQHNILSKKITLNTAVKAGQILSFGGELATTGSATAEPAGVAMYEGNQGEIIAIMCVGVINVPQDGSLQLGDAVKVTDGAITKADPSTDVVFATVSEVTDKQQVELLLK